MADKNRDEDQAVAESMTVQETELMEIDPALSPTLPSPMSAEQTPTLEGSSQGNLSAEMARGTVVGRYMVLDLLGSGGMGRVYTAYDPDLDRKVALKLLRPLAGDRSRLESRLLREAQALARLNHPQVVAVFDVGTVRDADGERVFVAMELVEGLDLHGWLLKSPRTTNQILDVFLDAGRGLAAAHDAGLVHRDFKPGNVLVGDDRRVRVCDFGLAASSQDESPRVDLEELESTSPERLDVVAGLHGVEMTKTGVVLGTPSFMAPEQRHGQPVGPAADQYSFCVALYRALYGEWPEGHPRAGEATGIDRDPDRLAMRLEATILRGLDASPEQRHGSMQDLLDEIERLRGSRRSRGLLAAGGLAIVVAASLVAFMGSGPSLCGGGAIRMAGVWDAARKSGLQSAFAKTGSAFAGDAATAVVGTLDTYRDGWIEMHRESCRATRRGEQSEELLDLRMACLDERRVELRSLVTVLTDHAADTARSAAEAAASLPSLGRCADTAALLAPLPVPDPETEEAVAVNRARLAKARALGVGGLFDSGLKAAQEVVALTETLEYWPLTAEALFEVGRAHERLGEVSQAIETMEQALLAAQAGRHDRVAVESFLRLVRLVGHEQVDIEAGARYANMARSLLQELGEKRGLEITLEDHLGLLSIRRGDYDAAAAHHGRALEIIAGDSAGRDLTRARSLIRLGNAERAAGRLRDAEQHTEQAAELYFEILGDSHPDVAMAWERLGGIVAELGETDRAIELRRRAADAVRRGLGNDHLMLADTLQNLGSVLLENRRTAEARKAFEEALRIYEGLGEAGSLKMAVVVGNLGYAALQDGMGDEALKYFGQAWSLYISIHGEDHPNTGLVRYNLAEAYNELGDFARALEHHQAVLESWQRRLDEGHYFIAHALTGEGRALIGLGRPAEAVTALEHALSLWSDSGRPAVYSGETSFHLARALWTLGEHARALELGRWAREQFSRSESHKKQLDTADLWLKERS